MNNTTPNAAQKKWMADIAEFTNDYGCFDGSHAFQLHHVCGRSYKQDKVPIGHWFILAVPVALHDVGSNHPDNVTHFRKRFTIRFGQQRNLWGFMVEHMRDAGYTIPFGDDVINAIHNTRY